jgi:hypothetical protein
MMLAPSAPSLQFQKVATVYKPREQQACAKYTHVKDMYNTEQRTIACFLVSTLIIVYVVPDMAI